MPMAITGVQRHDFSLKRLSLRFKAGSKGKAHTGTGWSAQHKWSLEKESLAKIIWSHQELKYLKYPEHIPIDIECGIHNPSLSLLLYPFGLFEDKNKSMTLMVKVFIPDECPPIPSHETFDMRWGVSIAANTLESSKRAEKIKFKTGVKYIHRFLLHRSLQQNDFERLEIRVHISTTYVMHK